MKNVPNIRLHSIKEETVRNMVFIVLVFSLVLFFTSAADAQVAEAQVDSLIGTIEGKDVIGAILGDTKGAQSFYRLGDKLPDGSQIVEVRSDSISLRGTDGLSYDMYIHHDTKKNVASVQRQVTADPYAPGAIRNTAAEQSHPKTKRGRRGRAQSEDE